MHWKLKAMMMRGLSSVPLGSHLHYALQRHVTKSLPVDDKKFSDSVLYAKEHFAALKNFGAKPIGEAHFYEFGAGWDLLIPLCFYCFGVERQTLVDILPLVRPKLVNSVIERLQDVSY